MAIDGLTEKQSNFIETFITMPLILGRDKAKQKRKEWAAEFEQFNDHKARVKSKVDGLTDAAIRSPLLAELARTQATLVEGDGKPDFDGARKRLEFVESAALIQPEHEICLALIENAANEVKNALAHDLGNAGEIQSALDQARDQARKGATNHDMAGFAACKKTLETVKSLTEAAQTDLPARQKALEKLPATQKKLSALRAEMGKAFGDPVPVPLATRSDEIAAALSSGKAGDSESVKAAILAAERDIPLLDTEFKAMIKDHSAWVVARQVFDTLFKVLSNHPRKGDATFVADLFAGLEADFEAARKKAEEQFKYAEATTDIAGLPDRTRKAISVADDVAQYEAVRADREKRVKELPDPAKVTEGAPRDKVTEVKAFYDDAVAEFLAGQSDKDVAHISRAVALLEKVPDGVREALDLAKYAKLYKDAHQGRLNDKATLAGWAPVYKQHLNLEIALFTKLVDEASLPDDLAARKPEEYRAAAVKLGNLESYTPTLSAKFSLIDKYLVELRKLKDRFTEIKDITEENGKAAVADYRAKLQSDGIFATAQFVAKDYSGALQACLNTAPEFEAQKKLAGLAKEYLAEKKAAEEKIVQLKAKGGSGNQADQAAASIESVIASAKDEATAKHWPEALDLIKKAKARLVEAEKIGTAIASLNGAWEDVSTQAVDAAHAKFVIIHDKVDGDDPDDVMATPLAAQKKIADDAQVAGKKSGGDPVAAAGTIANALTQVYFLGQQLAHREAYQALYDTIKQAHEVDLIKPEVNKDNIIGWYITELGNHKTTAKGLADPPNLNFPEALKELAVAEREMLRAQQISADWVKLSPTLKKIDDLAASLSDGILDGNFATEKARLEKYSKDVDDEIVEGKFELVRSLVKEGGVFADSLKGVTDKYRKVKNAMAAQITPMRAQITEATAPHAKDARVQVAKYDTEITDLLSAHASEAAWNVAGKLYWAIKNGVALNKLAEQYFTLKKTCEDTLRDYGNKNSSSNTKVSERLEELNEHFEGGSIFDEPDDLKTDVSTWEASQNFNGGIKRLTPIPDECKKLDADIKAYDDCKTQRDKSGAEVGKVLKNATGDIAPIAARLRGKHQNAVKIMDAGNYALALTMFKELEGDATKAAESAKLVASLQKEIADLQEAVPDDQLGPKVISAKAQIAKLRETANSVIADKELEAAEKAIGDAEDALGKETGAVRDAVGLAMKEVRDAMQRIELFGSWKRRPITPRHS